VSGVAHVDEDQHDADGAQELERPFQGRSTEIGLLHLEIGAANDGEQAEPNEKRQGG